MEETHVEIDIRPIGIVALVRSIRFLAFFALLLLFFIIINLPTPAGLSVAGQKAIAIFIVCLLLWITQLIPLAVTSLLALALLPLSGVISGTETYSLFGNEAVFFIMGAFILAAAVVKSGLSSRLALLTLRYFGSSPQQLIFGIIAISTFLAFWMPEHAVAAMMFPISIEIARSLKLKPGSSNYGKAIFLAMSYGAITGGVATFLGGARNPLAIAILKKATGKSIGFFQWMVAIVPLVLFTSLIAYFLIVYFYRPDVAEIGKAKNILKSRLSQIGRMSLEERVTGIVMLITILAWIFYGEMWGLANIAIVAVASLFILRLVSWKDIEDYVNWGVILMYGGAIALGYALEITKAASWVAKGTITSWISSPLAVLITISIVAVFLTEGISNVAVVAILMPIGVSLSKSLGVDPRIITMMIAVPSGLAFMLPMGTPPNAIAFSSGFVGIRDMIKVGFVLNAISLILFFGLIQIYWPLIGLRI